ncbi:LuxR C-terminal-related transcriptional regulator [Actinoallomurus sp. NPDC052274]|uniref:response regulator transcription factor n=1 Tax=Actinoallomurus sp. NPDC052274 TaxID=3155420 RepID=UPI00343C0BB1
MWPDGTGPPYPVRGPGRSVAEWTTSGSEVVDLVVGGRTNTEIARTLSIAETTVKTHLGRVLDKLGLRGRVHAVIYAYENALLRPGTRR